MKLYSLGEHLRELRTIVLRVLFLFLIACCIGYYFRDDIFQFMLNPVAQNAIPARKVIYTGLTEAFVAYLNLSIYTAIFIVMPWCMLELYFFLRPGLLPEERKMTAYSLVLAVILFYSGAAFAFWWVIPRAWSFFLSFQLVSDSLEVRFEPKISEYISLAFKLIAVFGLAFQMPLVIVLLCLVGVLTPEQLEDRRRIAIVAIFIIAAVFTPPDLLSQFALAIPLLLLYEASIRFCRILKRRDDARHKMD